MKYEKNALNFGTNVYRKIRNATANIKKSECAELNKIKEEWMHSQMNESMH